MRRAKVTLIALEFQGDLGATRADERKHKDTKAAKLVLFDKIFRGLAKIVRRGYSPPGTGGVDAPSRKCREATFEGAAGVVSSAKTWARRSDHPVCAASVASRLFISCAATPPVPGGEYARLTMLRIMCPCGYCGPNRIGNGRGFELGIDTNHSDVSLGLLRTSCVIDDFKVVTHRL